MSFDYLMNYSVCYIDRSVCAVPVNLAVERFGNSSQRNERSVVFDLCHDVERDVPAVDIHDIVTDIQGNVRAVL